MRVFLAFPFTDLVRSDTGMLHTPAIDFISVTVEALKEAGHSVFSAHAREEWGLNLFTPEMAAPADFEEMRRADIVVAFPGHDPISGGVHVELGWASALGKPMVLYLNQGTEYSPLVVGMGALSECIAYRISDYTQADLPKHIVNAVAEYGMRAESA
jgi:nucleoside 2-deoxyribosyltransferase